MFHRHSLRRRFDCRKTSLASFSIWELMYPADVARVITGEKKNVFSRIFTLQQEFATGDRNALANIRVVYRSELA